MWGSRVAIALVAVLCLGAAPAAATQPSGAVVDRGGELPRLDWPTGRAEDPAYDPNVHFVGIDGLLHTFSSLAVPGRDGYYYIGVDFDTACAFGAHIKRSMRHLAAVARIIERSGRRAVFTVAPNKAAAVAGRLPETIPQGVCGQYGLVLQNDVLDTFESPSYVPLRKSLLATDDAYWRTDSHWSTVGTSVFALRLARHLDPRLAERQRYRKTTRTRVGDLEQLTSVAPVPESAPARVPANGVRTRPVGGSPEFDPTFAAIHTDLSWASRPAARTYPGRTLLLGDSFTYVGLEALRNLFRRGRFLWIGTTPDAEVFKAVRRSDTVVMSVVQRFITATPLVQRQFRAGLRKALSGGR